MDVDLGHLQRFADVPYVVEAPASKAARADAAAAALAKGAELRWDDGRGVTPERYRAMVEAIRRDLRENLKPRPDHGIAVFDFGAPDHGAEMARIDPSLRMAGPVVGSMQAQVGPFSSTFAAAGGPRCVAVGYEPGKAIGPLLARGTGHADVPRGGLDDETFHRIAILHEVGHCLLGRSEAKADAFGALMVLREPAFEPAALDAWIAWREREELILSDADDEHYTASAVRAVRDRAGALRDDPAFARMSIEEVAGLANALAEDHGLSEARQAEARAVRTGLQAGARALAPAAAADATATVLEGWLAANRDIPELGRVLRAAGRGGPVDAAPGPAGTAVPFRQAVGRLADAGDPVAAAAAGAYDASIAQASAPRDARPPATTPYRFGRTAWQARVSAARVRQGAAEVDAPEEAPGYGPGPR